MGSISSFIRLGPVRPKPARLCLVLSGDHAFYTARPVHCRPVDAAKRRARGPRDLDDLDVTAYSRQ